MRSSMPPECLVAPGRELRMGWHHRRARLGADEDDVDRFGSTGPCLPRGRLRPSLGSVGPSRSWPKLRAYVAAERRLCWATVSISHRSTLVWRVDRFTTYAWSSPMHRRRYGWLCTAPQSGALGCKLIRLVSEELWVKAGVDSS